MNSRICAVVVTYNRKELLQECIAALMAQSMAVDILIIDNASTDGTKEALRSRISDHRIRYYNTGSNLGGAGGFHYGVKRAMSGDYDYLWLMDDDTIADSDAARQLYQAACLLKDKFGFLSSTVFYNADELCEMNRPGVSREWLDMEKYQYIKKGLISVRYASFVSFFVRTEVVRRVGLPLKEFFIWNDDYEYTTRISKLYDSYLVCDSVVQHRMKMNQTTDILTESSGRIGRYFFHYRNGLYVARRDGAKETAKYFLSVLELLCKIMFGRTKYRGKKCLIVLRGIIAGIMFRPQVEYVSDRSK